MSDDKTPPGGSGGPPGTFASEEIPAPPPQPSSSTTAPPPPLEEERHEVKAKERIIPIPDRIEDFPGFPAREEYGETATFEQAVIRFWKCRRRRNQRHRVAAGKRAAQNFSAAQNSSVTKPAQENQKRRAGKTPLTGQRAAKRPDLRATPVVHKLSGFSKAAAPKRPRLNYAAIAKGVKIIYIHVHSGTTRPDFLPRNDFHEVVQRVQEAWGLLVEAAGTEAAGTCLCDKIKILKTSWMSANGRGTFECANQETAKWVTDTVNGISYNVREDVEVDLVTTGICRTIAESVKKTFRAWTPNELKEMAFCSVFLDLRYQRQDPMLAVRGALRQCGVVDTKDLSVVKVFKTTSRSRDGKISHTGFVVKLVMDMELALKIKELQDVNGAVLAGTGSLSFTFGKEDEVDKSIHEKSISSDLGDLGLEDAGNSNMETDVNTDADDNINITEGGGASKEASNATLPSTSPA